MKCCEVKQKHNFFLVCSDRNHPFLEQGKCENMVNFMLYISADLENLTNFQPAGGVDDPNFTYYFKLKCENCGEVTEKETCVSLNETLPLPKKGTTNLIQKCKFCKREGTVTMIPGRGSPLTNELSEGGKHAALMVFDCRGFEPLDFAFSSGWKAESIEGTKFEDIDLSGGDFSEYDEKGACPVMISNVAAMFKVVDLSKKNL
ncbi:unnamed protein product [Lactuca saligna]|uniref:CXXC motif containing zinc binding protein n=1 Tax=Lactuca saligna TaxID=75948 RepID=A0AA35YJI4_LACSI|nr:unnamed protein product [Lactuca saligna]